MLFSLALISCHWTLTAAPVATGAEVFLGGDLKSLAGKRVGLLSNQAAYHRGGFATWQVLASRAKSYRLTALFGPEHGFFSQARAYEQVVDETITPMGTKHPIKVYSLYGKQRKPTPKMLSEIDVLLIDLQDVGVRCYTYASSMFYAMDAAAEAKIPVIVLDRPNPLGGEIVDGPILETALRSFVGGLEIPFCHGMTLGELARLYNGRCSVKCALTVIPMRGYRRYMTFEETHLPWIPTSAHIPEGSTPLYYASTNLLGDLGMINHGVGFTTPFKVIGAPWIDSERLQRHLMQLKLPGAQFYPFRFTPFYGAFKGVTCSGILLNLKAFSSLRPYTMQLQFFAALKILYPAEFAKACATLKARRETFDKHNGTKEMLDAISAPGLRPLLRFQERIERDRQAFLKIRRPYLIADYN